MKKNLITLLFVFTVINMFGQVPATPKTGKTNTTNTSLSPAEMVTNKAIRPIKKIPLDDTSILIYDYDGSLFSFDLVSESINWTVKATDAPSEMCANKITLLNGVLYVPFINGEIFAIDNQSGDLFWKSRLGNITDQIVLKDQTPIINDGKLFITAQNQNQGSNLYALDIKDGSLVWNYKLDSAQNDIQPLFFNNKIFLPSATNLYSFDAKTGKVITQKTFEENITGKPITDGENIFVASEKNTLHALSPEKLDVLWQFKFDENQNNVKERILYKDKKIFIGAQGSQISSVYAIDSKAGTQLWKVDFKDDNIEYITEEVNNIWGYTKKKKLFQLDFNGETVFETKLTTLPVSNIEFPADDNLLYYYCDAGLIQFDLTEKDENVYYMRTTLGDNVYTSYLKIIR
ncbi:PQQ-binding-like beta-propeller repeat protein [Flavobacterium panacagri]|uniref:outer membrane protein assembly factor BamB family protein n=1 Tax=Flavobacterium panacagri TaxID=3034146 RepID=UPI0025A5306A|nr:PQQ-binding-like beta-propeller repeat protein [Flavobacterium panacagri]